MEVVCPQGAFIEGSVKGSMMKLKLTVGISFLLCAPAVAQDVYPGCEVPTTVAGRHTFFVDPVKGSDNGDGSMAKPWKSLNTVFAPSSKLIATKGHKTVSGSPLLAVNPTAPIKGGDVIMLMSGDYGDVTLMNAFNDKFITVMAAPGQTPIIQHLKVAGAARWIFQQLTFQSMFSSAKPDWNKLALITDGWGETTTNVIFNADTFQTAASTNGWTEADWYSKPNYFALGMRATCAAITGSSFRNIWNGIEQFGPKTLISNNTFDSFSNDAIDLNASNVSIFGNTIQNPTNNSKNNQHPDAIQGWSPFVGGHFVPNSNILIDSNKIYNASHDAGNYLQGINLGSFDNVVVQNNMVLTNHWIGIILAGTRHTKVINNTVMPTDPVNHPTWILIQPSQKNDPSNDVVVRNNAAYTIRAEDTSIVMDHNTTSFGFSTLVSGKPFYHKTSDTQKQNIVSANIGSDFQNWAPKDSTFNLHLSKTSALIQNGDGALAPSLDADGKRRVLPVDRGAFAR